MLPEKLQSIKVIKADGFGASLLSERLCDKCEDPALTKPQPHRCEFDSQPLSYPIPYPTSEATTVPY